ncbi:MAG: hypothetical protein EBR02_08550, partial [Alphaproteobacteria bacterium]|nr:hypothetical protein [Alphaproteobacteria bacterium]
MPRIHPDEAYEIAIKRAEQNANTTRGYNQLLKKRDEFRDKIYDLLGLTFTSTPHLLTGHEDTRGEAVIGEVLKHKKIDADRFFDDLRQATNVAIDGSDIGINGLLGLRNKTVDEAA